MGIEQREDKKYLEYEKKALKKATTTRGNEDFEAAYDAIVKLQSLGKIGSSLKGYMVVDSLRELLRLAKAAEKSGMNYQKLQAEFEAGVHKKKETSKVNYYDQVNSAFCGGFEQYWIGPYRWQTESGKSNDLSEKELVDLCEIVSDNCGYCIIYEEAVIFAKKPTVIDLDEERYWKDGVVTNENGPVIQFSEEDKYYIVNNNIKTEEEFNKEKMKRNSKLLKVLGDL